MSTKFDAYIKLFEAAWQRCDNGAGASIRLASVNDLSTVRTYLSRWKSLKKVEWPHELLKINAFRFRLRKNDAGQFFLDFYAFNSTTNPHASLEADSPPPAPQTVAPVAEAQAMDAPVARGAIPASAVPGIDLDQMVRRQDWVRVLALRGWTIGDFLASHASTEWLHVSPASAEGQAILTHFPPRSESES